MVLSMITHNSVLTGEEIYPYQIQHTRASYMICMVSIFQYDVIIRFKMEAKKQN